VSIKKIYTNHHFASEFRHVLRLALDQLFTAAGPALRAEDKGPYALTLNKVELIPTLGALSPRGGPVQEPALIHPRFLDE